MKGDFTELPESWQKEVIARETDRRVIKWILIACAGLGAVIVILFLVAFVPTEFGRGLGVILIFALAVGIYFFPAIIADRCRHRNHMGIFLLNLLLGWTLLGWVVALIWAVWEDKR